MGKADPAVSPLRNQGAGKWARVFVSEANISRNGAGKFRFEVSDMHIKRRSNNGAPLIVHGRTDALVALDDGSP